MMQVTDRRRLGKSGLEVPVIGFGGAPLGNLFDEFSDEQARATVRAAYDVHVGRQVPTRILAPTAAVTPETIDSFMAQCW